jgi:chemotaxis protein MotB
MNGGRWEVEVTDSTEEDSWLVTYLDVITLLLVMFVMMLALSGGPSDDPGPNQRAESAEAGRDVAGAMQGETVLPLSAQTSGEDEQPQEERFDLGDLGDSFEVSEQAGQLRFRISNDILFPSGEGMLTPAGFNALQKLVPLLEQTDYHVTVAGHTDNVPIRTGRYPSNWELSSARAASVVRYFIRRGLSGDRFSAVGLASTRPLADNESEQGRAKNRRVVLTLHRPGETPRPEVIRVPVQP